MNALIADDAKMMRTIVRRCLEAIGITEIDEAEDGQQAIEGFDCSEYGIVFTDWNMPNKNGLEVLEHIRKTNKQVPVLMITTEGQREQIVAAAKAGVTDYLIKPFNQEDLKAKIEKHLGIKAT